MAFEVVALEVQKLALRHAQYSPVRFLKRSSRRQIVHYHAVPISATVIVTISGGSDDVVFPTGGPRFGATSNRECQSHTAFHDTLSINRTKPTDNDKATPNGYEGR